MHSSALVTNSSPADHARERAADFAADWASDLERGLRHELGGHASIPVGHGVDEDGGEYVEVCGVRMGYSWRAFTAEEIARHVARTKAETGPAEWYANRREYTAFIAHKFASDFIGDPDGFLDWMYQLGEETRAYAVDYVAYLVEVGQ